MNEEQKRVTRSFSDEFKKDAVGLVVDQGYSQKQAADAVDVSTSIIRDWMEKFGPATQTINHEASKEQLQKEIKRLKQQIEQVKLETAVLKKATAYFKKESQ